MIAAVRAAPADSGVQPLDMLRLIALLSSLGELPAAPAFCLATGNTARQRGYDCGLIEVGRPADLLLLERAQHSAGGTLLESVELGDLPGIGMVIIDGLIRVRLSRNTPPPTTLPAVYGSQA